MRVFHLKRAYDLTPEDELTLLRMADYRCPICQRPFRANPQVAGSTADAVAHSIDHCHRTGRVRGVLCQRCNVTIGYFQDDPAVCLRAIAYLTQPPADAITGIVIEH